MAKRTDGRSRDRAASKAIDTMLSKLDPLLILGALSAGQEKLGKSKGGREVEFPGSLTAQMGPKALERFQKEDLVPVLVDAGDPDQVGKKVKQWNGRSWSVSATTLTVHVPRTRLDDLARLAAVRYVEASHRLKPHCDFAHASTGLLLAGQRTVPQTGAGVIVGVVDSGIDSAHRAFWTGSQSRIIDYLDQESGKHHSQAEISAGAASASADEIGHGTHVAGIAAGNGGGSAGLKYAGVAPNADLAVVKTTFQSDQIVDGIRHIFELAAQRKQPCVVNLSLGGHFGGHDGSSIAERTIDQLSGPGRLVVVSAGNEGRDPIHAGASLPAGQPDPARWVANFALRPRDVDGQRVGLLFLQVWHRREDAIVVRLRGPNGESFQPPQNDQREFDRAVFLVQASHQRAPYSGDHTTTFIITAHPLDQWLSGWSIIAEENRSQGQSGVAVGTIHAWIVDREMGGFTSGTTASHLVGMPGTAFSAITVAAHATRKEWTSQDPNSSSVLLDQIHLQDISFFSSPGPTRDGVNKPEVAAPGQWLISTLSRTASPEWVPAWTRIADIDYAAMQGTSMAAPYVTGALALLLEKEPTIDWSEAKRRLILSTHQDGFTRQCWNPRWGYGKIDVKRLLELTS